MLAHAPKPVFGVAIVRLAAMHDSVQPASVPRFNVLGKGVGFIEMVMPQKRRTAQKGLCLCRNSPGLEPITELSVYFRDGKCVGTPLRSQSRNFSRCDKGFKL